MTSTELQKDAPESSSLGARLDTLEREISSLRGKLSETELQEKLTIIVFSDEMDKAMVALNLATGGAAMGMEVNLFFTFWGTSILKKKGPQSGGKLFLQKMFGFMLPKGPEKLPLSKMNFAGMGPVMMKSLMKKFNTPSLPDLLQLAQECGVNFYICQMSMELMGIKEDELMEIEGLSYVGVASFLEMADRGKFTLLV